MSHSDDDEDLKRAIALSLQDPTLEWTTGTKREVISLDSDSETESRDECTNSRLDGVENSCSDSNPKTGLGLLGLDRKQMEQERLSRKRKFTSISPPPTRKALMRDRPAALNPTQESARIASDATPSNLASSGPSGKGPTFIAGTVKKTWAFGHERKGNDIKLEEVLQKDDLDLAVLSSFQWDIDWLLAKINTRATNITLVMQANNVETQQQYRHETSAMPNLRLFFPSMDGQINCMHSKLMLLSHCSYLRVVVPTANLVSYDWGETGIMENMVFLIDLPRLPQGQRTKVNDMTLFGSELIHFLEAQGLEHSIINSLYNFNFSATEDLAFIHTIGGEHSGTSWKRTGYSGLGRAVKELGLAVDGRINVDFVTSSAGSLNDDFLTMLYLAAQGDDGLKEYLWRNPPVASRGRKTPQDSSQATQVSREQLRSYLRQDFQIYFPTHETVKKSTAGSAGTICFQSKWYNSPTFPRESLRDCQSVRSGMLMHNKLLFVHTKDDASVSWVYVGSANCSESAWGKLVKDRVTKAPKLNCRNWECGVLMPIRRSTPSVEKIDLKDFEKVVPVPMQVPGELYGDRKPWYFMEQ